MATTPGSEASIIFGKGYHFRPAGLDRPPRLGGVRHRSGPRELLSHGVEGEARSSTVQILKAVPTPRMPRSATRTATPGYSRRLRRGCSAGSTPRRRRSIRRAIWRARFGRAAAAHGEHEKRLGKADPNWSDWYAEYMVAEQAGTEPPQ